MPQSKNVLHEALRTKYLEKLKHFLAESGEEILVVGTNEIAFPCVDDEGNDEFLVLTLKVPTGSRDDGLPYDGYAMAESFAMKQKEKSEKALEAEKKKQAKIEKDKRERELKAKIHAEKKGE